MPCFASNFSGARSKTKSINSASLSFCASCSSCAINPALIFPSLISGSLLCHLNLTGAIARLKTLLPKRFNFIDEPSVTRDGFLAHEVTTVPEAVWGTKDAVEPEDNEKNGVKKGDPIYQQLDQSKLVPLLTAALQEAVAKIETLEKIAGI